MKKLVLSRLLLFISLHLAGMAFAQTAKPSTERLVKATDLSLAYFQNKGIEITPDAYLIHRFLERKFGVPGLHSYADFLAQLKLTEDWNYAIEPFLRIAAKQAFDPKYFTSSSSLDSVTICGIWYDYLKPKRAMYRYIRKMYWSDPYCITHAFLVLAIVEKEFKATIRKKVMKSLKIEMKKIINDTIYPINDVEIEAMALVKYYDPNYAISGSRIEELLQAQTEAGGWESGDLEKHEISDHTSIFALWVLLQELSNVYPPSNATFIVK